MSLRFATLLCVACGLLGLNGPAVGAEGEAVVDFDKEVKPFLQKHCVDCHGPDSQEGNLRLDDLSSKFEDPGTVGKWIEVMDRMNLGEMPPEYMPQPDPHNLRRVSGWVAGELRAAEKRALGSDGGVLLRRLNRTEYANTARDLLGVTFYPGEGPLAMLPPDGTAEGFDTVSAALTMDPSLLDQYFGVGKMVAEKAIVDGPPEYPTEVMRASFGKDSDLRYMDDYRTSAGAVSRDDAIGLVQKDSLHLRFALKYPDTHQRYPVKGDYKVRLRVWADPGESDEPMKIALKQGHALENLARNRQFTLSEEPQVIEFDVKGDPGSGHWSIDFLSGTSLFAYNPIYWHISGKVREFGEKGDFANVMRHEARRAMEGGHNNGSPNSALAEIDKLPRVWLSFLEVEGPIYEQWPPSGHQFLFTDGDGSGNRAKDLRYAREMFTRLLPKAFRRPIDPAEVEPYVNLIGQEMDSGLTFKEAVRSGLAAVMTAPSFVYLFESSAEEGSRPLDGYELASRLSYFLWSSMPDDELFALAENGTLTDPAVLDRQVDRMLDDEKAEALVTGFAAQWLRTSEFRNFTPNEYVYKEYDERLGEAMVEEPLAFFREVLKNDLDVASFVDSDWTMVNERLAQHYGVKGIKGEAFRRVSLPADSRRGGLLSMGGVSMWGSDGLRTKPVNRAVYVREVLFNDPPDPPPPNVGEVEPNIKGENLTVRERLEQHRQIAACASCHRGLDPYGLALENFNVIGSWRDKQDGEDFRRSRNAPEIDPSGTLPNGESFETFAEFKALLAEQDERLNRGLAEKFFVYAMGRPVESTDRGTIDEMISGMVGEERTLRTLIKGLVGSRRFREK